MLVKRNLDGIVVSPNPAGGDNSAPQTALLVKRNSAGIVVSPNPAGGDNSAPQTALLVKRNLAGIVVHVAPSPATPPREESRGLRWLFAGGSFAQVLLAEHVSGGEISAHCS